MVSSVNSSLLNYLTSQGQDTTTAATLTNGKATTAGAGTAQTGTVPKAALDRAAGTTKSLAAGHSLESGEKKLATDLRAALAKAGVKLSGAVEFSVKSDGTVETKGSDADKAALKAFLNADTTQPSFANRMATQAKDAMKLSSTIQQSAAISQAAKVAGRSGNLMSLYNTYMQQSAATTVVFSVSAATSSLTYPGSLAASA